MVDISVLKDTKFVSRLKTQFHSCGLLWDGYEFSITTKNLIAEKSHGRNFSHYTGEITTFPFPGYNEYYRVDYSQIDLEKFPAADSNREYFIWCGDLFDMVPTLGLQYGAKIIMKGFPTNEQEGLALVLSENFMGVAFHFSQAQYFELNRLLDKLFPGDSAAKAEIFPRQIFFADFEPTRLLAPIKFARRDFLFLNSLSWDAWIGVFVSLLTMALLFVVFRLTSRKKFRVKVENIVSESVYSLLELLNPLLLQATDSNSLLGGRQRCRLARRILFGFWLTACLILSIFIASNLRDLMADTKFLLIPKTIEDLIQPLENNPFSSYYLMRITGSSPANEKNTNIRILRETGRALTQTPMHCINAPWQVLSWLLSNFYLYAQSPGIIMGLTEKEYLVLQWAIDLYASHVTVALTQILGHDDKLQQVAENLRDNFIFAPSTKLNHMLFIPLGAAIPEEIFAHIETVVRHRREAGFLAASFDGSESRLESRYGREEEKLAAVSSSSYQDINLADLNGANILWAGLLGTAWASFAIEWITVKINRKKINSRQKSISTNPKKP